ncbi:MAG TPA: polysaccharide deacetylase family protein [Sphingobacteriaceae bacterium]
MTDPFGAVVRGDTTRKEIALVFTGHEFADGGSVIRKTLRDQEVNASFFFTGHLYRDPGFGPLISGLKHDGHYLGAHSDEHLLYCDWVRRDSVLVTEKQFRKDLRNNYKRMKRFGIKRKDARFFLPPYEWYNAAVAEWTKKAGFRLVNFTHGTRSTADYTYPEMGKSYRPSDEIYRSVTDYEKTSAHGLNGFILLVHIGTDPRRTDKFYYRLDQLITELKKKGYTFLRIDDLLD